MTTSEILNTASCWRLLASAAVGRIGFDVGRGPRIHPVNYTVDGRSVLVRTTTDSELGLFAELFSDGALVAFEVDDIDVEGHEGWSVLVGGRLSRVLPGEWDFAARRLAPRPWADVTGDRLLRITPSHISGRRLRQGFAGRPKLAREASPPEAEGT